MTEAIIEFSIKVYTLLLPLAWIGLALVILILVPMSFFRSTRAKAGTGMFYFSWLLGATTWFLSCAITFATWGWVGLIIGLLLFGAGVVPIAILASFISLENMSMGISLIVMVIIVIATRFGGFLLTENAENKY